MDFFLSLKVFGWRFAKNSKGPEIPVTAERLELQNC